MQSTGQAVTQAVSLTPIHGSAMTNATINSLSNASKLTPSRSRMRLTAHARGDLQHPPKKAGLRSPVSHSTSHLDWAINVPIGVRFLRHNWYLKEITLQRRGLYFPFQSGSAPWVCPRDLAVL